MAQRMTLRDRDIRTMLRVCDADDPAPGPGALPWSVLHGLRSLIACDMVAVFQLDSDRQRLLWGHDVPDDEDAAETEPAFWAHYRDCPPCCYPDETGDLERVTTFSDFYTMRELRSTGMYADYLRPAGVERELMLCLPSPARRTVRLVLFRGPGSDFGERDRALLRLLRPHLHRLRTRPVDGLTDRQRQLLDLVAAGYTNGQIARRLGLADSTVRKHLENIFERLQVHSRTAAVARIGLTAD
jgi:DNA-binding CsgD family transcriptional regulator